MTCDHCEELRAEIEYLRGELAKEGDAHVLWALQNAFGITGQQARLLNVLRLRAGRVVPTDLLESRLPTRRGERKSTTAVKVQVRNLRRQLGPGAILTSYGDGYCLTADGKRQVDEALAREAA